MKNLVNLYMYIRECFRTSGCSWCTSDKSGKLVNGFCDLKEICPSQQCLKDGMNLQIPLNITMQLLNCLKTVNVIEIYTL